MSMFTGLKAVNHFGRPDMSSFLKFVQKKHSYVSLAMLLVTVVPQTGWLVHRGVFCLCTDTKSLSCSCFGHITLFVCIILPSKIMIIFVCGITKAFLYINIHVCVVEYYRCKVSFLLSYVNYVFHSLNKFYIYKHICTYYTELST
jgi:hypothetical protein